LSGHLNFDRDFVDGLLAAATLEFGELNLNCLLVAAVVDIGEL
jgi:hypothetical protein